MDDTPEEVARHYAAVEEGRRITEGIGQLELRRTQEVLGRHLPATPITILDVGGATGVHAEWLAALGHAVHVVDPMPHHVAEAARLEAPPGGVTAEVGDARRLRAPDHAFDAALLFGPLYHLTDRADRLQAWAEARRVVRPGGLIFAAAISRFASLLDGLSRGFLFDPEFRRIVERDLRDGQHRNPHDVPGWFTTAYFHRPEELRLEAADAGVEIIELVGLEGLAHWLPHLTEQWATSDGQETILFAARVIEAEPALLGLSGHLLAVTQNPS
jgi:SAM-dependent methyltransferase